MSESDGGAIRIGGAAGFWGDSAIATPQLLRAEGLDYLVYDYLAETTMAILSRARLKNAALGYATDFIPDVIEPHLATALQRGVKIIANAGGLNPLACKAAILEVAQKSGLSPRVAVITGDDLLPAWNNGGVKTARRLDGEHEFPAALLSMNVYTGARGIARALDLGADIVITGRAVDSAAVLGAAVHEFGWAWDAWDQLAGATIAGHLIECGAQATGGLFTDWRRVADWSDIGYPLIAIANDGSCVLSKPPETGGLIDPLAVSEQLLYEVGDPQRYLMPDVTCDICGVSAEWHGGAGSDKVRISGVRGFAPGPDLKGNATWQDGFQIQQLMAIRGFEAPEKATRTAQALLARTSRQMKQAGFDDYTAVTVELLGCEALYGPHAQALSTREVVLRIAARHSQAKALRFLQKECSSAGTSMAPGTRSSFSGRSDIQSLIRVLPFLIEKSQTGMELLRPDGSVEIVAPHASGLAASAAAVAEPDEAPASCDEETIEIPLIRIAVARSGDKGDDENIGVIARQAKWLPLIRRQLTAAAVAHYFAHLAHGPVERFDVPGLNALNFVLHDALGGGGVSSLRSDPLGKSFAQMLLAFPILAPKRELEP